jgi:DNA modification methylase
MYRNGKCLSYKKDFEKRKRLNRLDIHEKYVLFIENNIYPDIQNISKYNVTNFPLCKKGDSRKRILKLQPESIDLIITSPPYLNSRDYTDSYLDELRVLDYIKDMKSEQKFRRRTIRSHVQVKWDESAVLDIEPLKKAYDEIEKNKESFWNSSILSMISGYFNDMKTLFNQFYRIMKYDSYIYFNVANSSYFKIIIPVDEIISEIATNEGFEVIEIREARKMKSSSQQKNLELAESVIVIKKTLHKKKENRLT